MAIFNTYMINKIILLTVVSFLLSSCAVLHKTQLGDVDSVAIAEGYRFEVMVSEVGVSAEEAAKIAEALGSNTGQDLANTLALFQVGPRTGKPVYSEKYAENIVTKVYEKCPSGRITGLTSIRETMSYPVVSGEIVKVTGYCIK